MDKLLGILPYVYFMEPVELGDVIFLGFPDWQDRDHAPATDSDKRYLSELFTCFPTTRGLGTNTGIAKAKTYCLLDRDDKNQEETLVVMKKAVTLLRYALLRPDTQALDDIESTYLYAFALPPTGTSDYRLYQCWPNLNQEIGISPEHQRFPLPGWNVDSKLVNTSNLEDIAIISEQFYSQKMPEKSEADILLAIEWYNQSFQKYSIRNIFGYLVDVSIAFETLFQLQKNKITLREAITQTLGAEEGSEIEHWAGTFYGQVRSATTHSGKPASLLYQHTDAQTPHLSFLQSSQRIFRECISAKTGLPRHTDLDRLTEQLIPNEIHLNKLKEAGSFQKILEDNLLGEVEKLRPIYPAGRREDIIWLGKELLRGYKEQYKPNQHSLPTLQLILDSDDTGSDLGLQYYRFSASRRNSG